LILLCDGDRLWLMLDFERILKDRGYRLTNQRRIIVHELEGERHLSAEEIYDRVKGEHPELGLSTVYRTLDLLTELGIVRKDDFGEGYSRYELATERMHHHARCEQCGKVIEFNEELMEYLALQVERETGFVTDWHEITLYGRCAECAVT
jgi:Fur family transcriptional regulator, ferric uptake regulator